jgi:hypothetical protein
MNRCTKCKKDLPDDMFYNSKTRKSGLTAWCKECSKNNYSNLKTYDPSYIGTKICRKCNRRKERREYCKRIHSTDGLSPYCKECTRLYSLSNRYRISVDDYTEMFTKQDGKCAICGQSETVTHKGKLISLCVDHNHITGEIRGLLCLDCNTGLGKFKDDKELLKKVICYLDT